MNRENSGETMSPSRRALLKAAAGGVFAVPLIASFSMDTASAQTKMDAFSSSNQSIFSSNMFCSNMTTVPTAVFYTQLQVSGAGPVVGLAGFEFVHGKNELFYELLVKGTLSNFLVASSQTFSEFFSFQDYTGSKAGAIPGSSLRCQSGPGDMALPTVYSGLAAGGSTVQVDLTDGTQLLGTIVALDHRGPFQHSFRFVGRH